MILCRDTSNNFIHTEPLQNIGRICYNSIITNPVTNMDNSLPSPPPQEYLDAEAARLHIESQRWRGRTFCPYCTSDDRISARTGERAGRYRCGDCGEEFTVRTKTILERSNIPLNKWLYALHLAGVASDRVSSVRLGKQVGVTQNTARLMLMRFDQVFGAGQERLRTIFWGRRESVCMDQRALDLAVAEVLAHISMRKTARVLRAVAGGPRCSLEIEGAKLPCYVLENEQRVLAQRGLAVGLGMSPSSGHRIGIFMGSNLIKPFVSNELARSIERPILFRSPAGGRLLHGYPASVLADICSTVLNASNASALTKRQEHIARRCRVLAHALVNVRITDLVDEVTGYEKFREQRALAAILEKHVAKDLRSWTRTFPVEFYEQIRRLKGWPDFHAVRRPSVIGRYTNDFVYERLAPVVLAELWRHHPHIPERGGRLHEYRRWFNSEYGDLKLREHLGGVMALMRAAPNWSNFRSSLDAVYPKLVTLLPQPFDHPNIDRDGDLGQAGGVQKISSEAAASRYVRQTTRSL